MTAQLALYWWVLALRGAAAVLFGLLALLQPVPALAILVILFGVYAAVDGVLALAAMRRWSAGSDRWWALLLHGIAGIGLGLLAFFVPTTTAVALLYVIAAWALLTGILEILAAIRLRRVIESEWLLGLSGLASAVMGILLIAWPRAGLLAIVWIVGVYALVYGTLLIGLALRLRGLSGATSKRAPA